MAEIKKISIEDYEKLMQYRRIKARKNLIDFCTLVHSDYEVKPVHYLIADRLEQAYAGNIERLMINTPPRIGKSELASKLAPTWYMGSNPGKSVVLATYSGDLAADFGSDSRNYVLSDEYTKIFPYSCISKKSQAKVGWEIETTDPKKGIIRRGEYINTSVGGKLTGKGGNVLTVDDPTKDRQDANSKTIQDTIWGWYTSTFASRGNDRKKDEITPIIVIMTRWSHMDLSGKLLELDANAKSDERFVDLAENWEVLSLPAIAIEDEEYYIHNEDYQKRLGSKYFRRKKGESLDPDLYPMKKLLKLQYQSPIDFAALYQQTPTVEGGLLFKANWFKEYDENKELNSIMTIHSYDTASSIKETSDPSTGYTFDFDGINLYMRKETRKRMLFPEIKKKILDNAKEHKPDAVLIESASSGLDLIADLQNTGLPIIPIKTGGDSKYIRAVSATPFVKAGKLKIPKNWVGKNDFIKEFTEFPNGRHDDRVDATGQAIRYVQDIMSNSYFMQAISDKNKFVPFTPPREWPKIRVINIPSNGEPFSVLWFTLARSREKIYDYYRLEENQAVVFAELVGVTERDGIEIPIKMSLTEIMGLVKEAEKNYDMIIDTTYINSDNVSEDPLQHGLFDEFIEMDMMPFPLKINSRVSAPYLYDKLSNHTSPLLITTNCKKLWRKLPFILSDPQHSKVFASRQELELINTLMMGVTPLIKGEFEKDKEKYKEDENNTYWNIFGGIRENESTIDDKSMGIT